jgi:hypothetical protein
VQDANDRKIVNGKVIKREDGKILKPEGWVAPEPQLMVLLAMGKVSRGISPVAPFIDPLLPTATIIDEQPIVKDCTCDPKQDEACSNCANEAETN